MKKSDKKTKPSKSQVEHIKEPFVDTTGDKAKAGKVRNTVKDTEKKYGGNAPKTKIKLKRK